MVILFTVLAPDIFQCQVSHFTLLLLPFQVKFFFLQRNSDVTLQIIIRRWSSFVFSKHIVQAFKERKDLLSYLLGRTNCTISLERYEKSIESIKGSSSIMLMMFGDKSKVALGQCCEIMAKVQLA